MKDRIVLLLGGSGSFGRAFIKRAVTLEPKILRVFANDECSLVETTDEFRRYKNLRFLLGDIRDKERLRKAMRGVEIVIHAAAVKHVPVCEYDPEEAVKTNVLGSINVGECAMEAGVDKVLFLSSDKAVSPINLYGATKLCGEKYFLSLHEHSATKFSCIRFGNFWGSRGSVIEKWEKQRQEGQPITVTDGDMSRYFINIDEATDFTVRCLDRMKGGEIFIPIMPCQTLKQLIEQVAPDATLNVVGRRRGEKKHELLYNEDEETRVVRQEDCLTIRSA